MSDTTDEVRPASAGGGLRWVVLVPALVAFVVSANTLGHGFVYDDPIILNWLEDRTWELPGVLVSKRPLTYAIHTLDRALWGEWAPGYHLTNVLLHAAATALAGWAAYVLTRSRRAALVCGVLFAVHPVHVEVVANISNRKDAVAMVFAMLALVLWVRPGRGWLRVAGCFACFVLGLYGKEVAIAALPAMLLAADLLFETQGGDRRERLRRAARHLAPLLAVALVGVVVFAGNVLEFFSGEAIAGKTDGAYDTLGASLATGAANLRELFRLLLFPRFLSIDYPLDPHAGLDGAVLLGLALLGAWLALALAASRRAPLVSFAMLWAFVMYLPCANVLPLHHILVAERYLYVPSFGVALLVGHGFDRATRAYAGKGLGWVPAVPLLLLLVAGAWRSVVRNGDWRNWDTLIAAGDRDGVDTWRLHKSAGSWAVRRQNDAQAVARYGRAVELRPRDPELHFWLAVSLQRAGQPERAIAHYREAVALDPTNSRAHYNLGLILIQKDDMPGAILCLRETIRLDGDYAPAHYNLGAALARMEQYDSAARSFEEAVRCAPDSADAHLNLGMMRRALGDTNGALESFRAAVLWDGGDLRALQELGDTAVALELHAEALAAYRQICTLRPADVETLEKIGTLHERDGDYENAAATYETALRHAHVPRIEAKLRALREGVLSEGDGE